MIIEKFGEVVVPIVRAKTVSEVSPQCSYIHRIARTRLIRIIPHSKIY